MKYAHQRAEETLRDWSLDRCGLDMAADILAALERAGLRVVDAAQLRRFLDSCGEPGRCDGPNCGREIWFFQSIPGNGRRYRRWPVTDEGLSHFVDCPDRDLFRSRR